MDPHELLKRLTETPGPSGMEGRVAEVVEASWGPLVDDVKRDRVGSLIAAKYGEGGEPRPKLLLAAHLDEIGLMVKQILPGPGETGRSGFLRTTRVGGVDVRHLYGQMVVVHGSAGGGQEIMGVVGSLPAWMLPEAKRDKAYDLEDLVVDVGLPYEEVSSLIHVGDFISFRQPMDPLRTGAGWIP